MRRMKREDGKTSEQPVVVWEQPQKAEDRHDGHARQPAEGGSVVRFRSSGPDVYAEPTVVVKSLPGRSGGALPAATVTYVGSGFWAANGKPASSGASLRMAA